MSKIAALLLLCIGATAAGADEPCLSVKDEPVSQCRAELVCGKKVAKWKRVMSSWMSARRDNRDRIDEKYQACIDRDLFSQRANAELSAAAPKCTLIQVDEETFKKVCK